MTAATTATIREKITSLDALVCELGEDFDREASEAVAGVSDAGRRAAEIDQRLARLAVDRRILSRALDRAIEAEALAVEAAQQAEQQRYMDAAREHAVRLVNAAARFDALMIEMGETLPVLEEAEHAIRQSLGRARFDLSIGGVRGRSGLSGMAGQAVAKLIDGRLKFSSDRPIKQIAATAWKFLLEDDANV